MSAQFVGLSNIVKKFIGNNDNAVVGAPFIEEFMKALIKTFAKEKKTKNNIYTISLYCVIKAVADI